MNAGADGVNVDARTIEAVLIEDVNISLDFHVVGCVFPTRVVRNAVDKVSQVDSIREGCLPRHNE